MSSTHFGAAVFVAFSLAAMVPGLRHGVAQAQDEKCQAYQPRQLRVQSAAASGWMVTDGGRLRILVDTEEDAKSLLRVASAYSSFCTAQGLVSRVEYWKGTGIAPLGPRLDSEDCNEYDPSLATVEATGDRYNLLAGPYLLVVLKNQTDASRVLEVVKQHHYHCFVGRRNKRQDKRLEYIIEYWR